MPRALSPAGSSTRRERLIAILTNVLVPCNGRFPTLITVASLFVAGAVAAQGTFAASLIGTAAVVMPLGIAIVVCAIVATVTRLVLGL